MPNVIRLTIRNRVVALIFAILFVGAGVVFVTVGMALLAALAVAGLLVGGGIATYRRLRGRSYIEAGQRVERGGPRENLDPSLEVQPERPAMVRPREDADK